MAASKCKSATPLIPVPPKSLIFLHEWWLVKQRKGLAVGGLASVEIADRERVFLSSVIVEREEANVLHSEDGITILFRGFINTSRSSQNGVPFQVCQHFLVGFPHDWKKYSAYSFGDAFGDSSACSMNYCDGLGISFGNHSKQSQSTDNMECECNNTVSQLQVGEKVISDVAVESQAGNKKSFMSMFDSNKCTSPSGKGTVKPLTSTQKMDRKEKQHIKQNIVLDASNSCNRMVTRSISKRSHTMPKEDEKATIATVVSPVRRSPRLYSRR